VTLQETLGRNVKIGSNPPERMTLECHVFTAKDSTSPHENENRNNEKEEQKVKSELKPFSGFHEN
jgi:hypothetical protein